MEQENICIKTEIMSWFKVVRPIKDQKRLAEHMKTCFEVSSNAIYNADSATISRLSNGISEDPEYSKYDIPGAGDDFKRTFLIQWNLYNRPNLYKKRHS